MNFLKEDTGYMIPICKFKDIKKLMSNVMIKPATLVDQIADRKT